MEDKQLKSEQSHPLYATDRDHVDRLMAKESPADGDLVDLARLFIRYEGFPGALDLQSDMHKTLNLWGIRREELNALTRKLWNEGFHPSQSLEDSVGSGFDTSEGGSN